MSCRQRRHTDPTGLRPGLPHGHHVTTATSTDGVGTSAVSAFAGRAVGTCGRAASLAPRASGHGSNSGSCTTSPLRQFNAGMNVYDMPHLGGVAGKLAKHVGCFYESPGHTVREFTYTQNGGRIHEAGHLIAERCYRSVSGDQFPHSETLCLSPVLASWNTLSTTFRSLEATFDQAGGYSVEENRFCQNFSVRHYAMNRGHSRFALPVYVTAAPALYQTFTMAKHQVLDLVGGNSPSESQSSSSLMELSPPRSPPLPTTQQHPQQRQMPLQHEFTPPPRTTHDLPLQRSQPLLTREQQHLQQLPMPLQHVQQQHQQLQMLPGLHISPLVLRPVPMTAPPRMRHAAMEVDDTMSVRRALDFDHHSRSPRGCRSHELSAHLRVFIQTRCEEHGQNKYPADQMRVDFLSWSMGQGCCAFACDRTQFKSAMAAAGVQHARKGGYAYFLGLGPRRAGHV